MWVAVPVALAINGFLLVGLTLFDPAPPVMDDSASVITLERPVSRQDTSPIFGSPQRRDAKGATRRKSRTASVTSAVMEPSTTSQPSLGVDPAWVLGDGAYLRPETASPARRAWDAADQRRYQRVCAGLSNEHMTLEEKHRCWDAWGGAKPVDEKRIGPREATVDNYAPGPAVRSRPDIAGGKKIEALPVLTQAGPAGGRRCCGAIPP